MSSKLLKNARNKKKPSIIGDTDRVVLKPILSVAPSLYLCVLYGAILFGGIMLIIHLVNKRGPGSYITVNSVPSHAAIYIDNSYVGVSPKKFLVNPGTHSIHISLLGFTSYREDIQVKNIVLLKRMRSRRIIPVLSTDTSTLENIVPNTIESIAGYANDTSTQKYQIPSTLTLQIAPLNAASNYYAQHNNAMLASMLIHLQSNLIARSLPYMNTQEREQEVTQAYAITTQVSHANNVDITIQGEKVSRYITDINSKPAKNNSISWTLASSPNTPLNDALQDSKRYPNTITVHGMPFFKVPPTTLAYHMFTAHAEKKNRFTYMEYTDDDSTTTTRNNTLTVQTPLFYVLSHEITQQEYSTFLQENPQWNTQALVHVSPDHTSTYLKEFDVNNAKADISMRHITWYDANEFVRWLNSKTQVLGYTAILPNEFEWRAASTRHTTTTNTQLRVRDVPDNTRSVNFMGGLWEWTSTWYSPLPQYAKYEGPQYGSEKIILGESYINESRYIHSAQDMHLTRNASYDPSWATAYVGFRVILVPNRL